MCWCDRPPVRGAAGRSQLSARRIEFRRSHVFTRIAGRDRLRPSARSARGKFSSKCSFSPIQIFRPRSRPLSDIPCSFGIFIIPSTCMTDTPTVFLRIAIKQELARGRRATARAAGERVALLLLFALLRAPRRSSSSSRPACARAHRAHGSSCRRPPSRRSRRCSPPASSCAMICRPRWSRTCIHRLPWTGRRTQWPRPIAATSRSRMESSRCSERPPHSEPLLLLLLLLSHHAHAHAHAHAHMHMHSMHMHMHVVVMHVCATLTPNDRRKYFDERCLAAHRVRPNPAMRVHAC